VLLRHIIAPFQSGNIIQRQEQKHKQKRMAKLGQKETKQREKQQNRELA